jgi:uncharacterized protein (TIRG00374 family)
VTPQASPTGRVRLPRLRIALGFAAAVVVLAGLAIALDWRAVLTVLGRTDPTLIAFAVVTALFALVAWSESLRALFAASGADLSIWDCLGPYGAATFVRLVVPVGQSLGPAVFVYLVGRHTDRSYSTDLAPTSIGEATNHLLSALLAITGGLLVFGTSAPVRQVRVLQIGLAAVFVTGLLLAAVLWFRRNSIRGWVLGGAALLRATLGRVSTRLGRVLAPERVDTSVTHYYETAADLADDPRLLSRAVGLAAVGWLSTALSLALAAESVGVSVSIPLALFVIPPVGLLGFLPLPGALGGVEVALSALLVHLAGIELAAAAAVVLLFRLCTYWLPLVVSGGVFTWVWTVGWDRGERAREQ